MQTEQMFFVHKCAICMLGAIHFPKRFDALTIKSYTADHIMFILFIIHYVSVHWYYHAFMTFFFNVLRCTLNINRNLHIKTRACIHTWILMLVLRKLWGFEMLVFPHVWTCVQSVITLFMLHIRLFIFWVLMSLYREQLMFSWRAEAMRFMSA